MLKYVAKRILIFIPTLIAISMLTFVISINAPGDPVESMLNQNAGGDGQSSEKLSGEKTYIAKRKELGFDLPLFYFSITNGTYPDTLHRIPKKIHRETLQRLSYEMGIWENVSAYYLSIKNLENKIFQINKAQASSDKLRKVKESINELYINYEVLKIQQIIQEIEFDILKTKEIKKSAEQEIYDLRNTFDHMLNNKNTLKKYQPRIIWYGFQNQYHRWISGFVTGDFGISYQDKRPVSSKIFDALKWSMILSILSIFIAYIVAIPLGVRSAVDKGKNSEKLITTLLFLLYSLPNFWIATMLIRYLGDGNGIGLFPIYGLGSLPDSAPFLDRFLETSYHFVLPLFCLTYASFAFISRQMRGGMLNVLEMDYIRTARAKGLNKSVVIWKHAFRNSLIPIITLFANIFPAAISGSFIIEVIYSIPGMGQLTLKAIFARDYPIVFTVLMFSAILTLVGNLVADILYAYVDPRISFSNKK